MHFLDGYIYLSPMRSCWNKLSHLRIWQTRHSFKLLHIFTVQPIIYKLNKIVTQNEFMTDWYFKRLEYLFIHYAFTCFIWFKFSRPIYFVFLYMTIALWCMTLLHHLRKLIKCFCRHFIYCRSTKLICKLRHLEDKQR